MQAASLVHCRTDILGSKTAGACPDVHGQVHTVLRETDCVQTGVSTEQDGVNGNQLAFPQVQKSDTADLPLSKLYRQRPCLHAVGVPARRAAVLDREVLDPYQVDVAVCSAHSRRTVQDCGAPSVGQVNGIRPQSVRKAAVHDCVSGPRSGSSLYLLVQVFAPEHMDISVNVGGYNR